MRGHLLAIVGPTAVGKSALALRIARRFGGEIVSADSRQVYRFMDIGTAKPSAEDLAVVQHHLVDIVDPDQEYSLALFLRQATAAIEDALSRSRLPIVVGGTGQYVWGLLQGWQVPPVPPDARLRRRLEEQATTQGPAELHAELAELDPGAAGRIDARDVRRVIRALEVSYSLLEQSSEMPQKRPPPYRIKLIGLTLERSALYRRIDDRVDAMVESGWSEEVRSLLRRGYGPELPSMSSLGYTQLVRHLNGELSLDEAVEQIKYRTHAFARRQYTWFRPTDEAIDWSDAATGFDEAEAAVAGWLST